MAVSSLFALPPKPTRQSASTPAGVHPIGRVVYSREATIMIVGTGIDLIEVIRIAKAMERYGDRFLNRIYTPDEIRYCNSKANRIERFAARFAAKEAAMKALGTGLGRGVSWQQMQVGHALGGRPTILFTGEAARFAAKLECKQASLSLSHTSEHAIAQVILEN